jgi:hypothetical protein
LVSHTWQTDEQALLPEVQGSVAVNLSWDQGEAQYGTNKASSTVANSTAATAGAQNLLYLHLSNLVVWIPETYSENNCHLQGH